MFTGVNGASMFGLGHDAVTYLTEQLNGAQFCRTYKFKFHKYKISPEEEVSVITVNPFTPTET